MNKPFGTITVLSLLVAAGMLFGLIPAGQAQGVQEWSDPINLSLSGAATNPTLVVDSSGVIHVIWVDRFDGFKYSQSTDGLTWTPPVTVNYPFSLDAAPPRMFADAEGSIHIFWLNNENKLSYARTLAENLDSPPAWRARIQLDSSVFDFDASLDAQGRMHVAYVKNPPPTAGTAGVYYKRSADAGLSWIASKLIFDSPYFRSLTAENAHIRLAAAQQADNERVYVVWDDRAQKRIFFTASGDGGLNWESVRELVAPEADLGFRTPYHADIELLEEKILATWFVGEPTLRCTVYSRSSSDGGQTWGEQIPVLPDSAQCPERSEFITIDPQYLVSLFSIQGELSLTAWNGETWSNPEVQSGPISITNPTTFDPILLGCKRAAASNGNLYVVGCDEAGGDIWFLARKLESLDHLFPLPSDWSREADVVSMPRILTSLASVADAANRIHAVWIEAPSLPTERFSPAIEYSRWEETGWSAPTSIFSNLPGRPSNLILQTDSQQRLLLSWVNQETGELMFTWSNSDRANNALEWHQPMPLPSPSKLTSSPDMLVDASDRIVIVYAITLNEERGVYMVQSNDLGQTWSEPRIIFDAAAERWEMVDGPKLTVGGDGALHVLFTRYTLLGEPQPVALYYSASRDGGVNWSPVEVVSEQAIEWSEIVAHRDILHRLWQERDGLTLTTSHQVSMDGGQTWEPRVKIPSESSLETRPTVVVDPTGEPHFIQVVEQDSQLMQEWGWSRGRWELLDSKKVASLDMGPPPIVEGGVTSAGTIYAIMGFENMVDDDLETRVISINRKMELNGSVEPFLAFISTPSTSASPTPETAVLPTPTLLPSLSGLDEAEPRPNRNVVGLVLLSLVIVFILVVTVPRRGKVDK